MTPPAQKTTPKGEQTGRRPVVVALLLLLSLLGASAGAQESGSRSLEGTGIVVRHAPGLEGLGRRILREYPALKERAETRLGIPYPRTLTVLAVREHEAFNAIIEREGGSSRPDHVAAVAFGFKDLIVLKSAAWTSAPGDEFAKIFLHEIVHCVLGHLQRRHQGCDIPRWLDEGLAQWVSEAAFRPSEPLDNAARNDELLSFEALAESFPRQEGASALAYAQSLSLVDFISRFEAEDVQVRGNIRGLLNFMSTGKSFESAVETVTGLSFAELEDAWRGELRRRLPLRSKHLPMFLFTGTLLILLLLTYATYRVRRERRLQELSDDDEDEPLPET